MAGERQGSLGARPRHVAASRFRPNPGQQLAPSGQKARYDANVAAIRLIHTLREEHRPATVDEQHVLARWSGWGAVPEVFDEGKTEWSTKRDELRALLTEHEYAQARRTTLNAHYTDPTYVAAMWSALRELGFQGGAVLEPGCGSGTFVGLAPDAARMVGIELDAVTAQIAQTLYPHADIRAESFADTRTPGGTFDAVIGNVPFADISLHDPVDNPNGHSLHNHFILKSLRLTRPGGIVAVLTSHYTLDAANPGARREIARRADLLGAIRLPTGAHRRTAGTDALTDLLILRRRDDGAPPAGDHFEGGRELTSPDADLVLDGTINAPKSFSLAALLNADLASEFEELQDRLRDRIILTWQRELNARRGAGGRIRERLQRIEVVELRHRRSRALDPHIHRHLWLNVKVLGEDGRWSNVDSRVAMKLHTVINAEGEIAARTDPEWIAALARHGYTIDDNGEIAELAHIVRHVSRRSNQIEANRAVKLAEWQQSHPGQEPDRDVLQHIDRWAWAHGRPNKPGVVDEESWEELVLGELEALDPHSLAALDP